MKKSAKILIILFFSSTFLFGQNISPSDSLEVVKTCHTLFSAIKANDHETIVDISTDTIYCIICFGSSGLSNPSYIIEKKSFLKNYLPTIRNSELFQRATKSNELILIKENGHQADIAAFLTIYKQDEIAPGHEGGQFGIYFKKVNGEFKFAGMETVP